MAERVRCPHCGQRTLERTDETITDSAGETVVVWRCDATVPPHAPERMTEQPCGYSEGRADPVPDAVAAPNTAHEAALAPLLEAVQDAPLDEGHVEWPEG